MTAGLIQSLVDENATRKLDQHDYRKSMTGMQAGMLPLGEPGGQPGERAGEEGNPV